MKNKMTEKLKEKYGAFRLYNHPDRERDSAGWTLGGLSHWDASDSDTEEEDEEDSK